MAVWMRLLVSGWCVSLSVYEYISVGGVALLALISCLLSNFIDVCICGLRGIFVAVSIVVVWCAGDQPYAFALVVVAGKWCDRLGLFVGFSSFSFVSVSFVLSGSGSGLFRLVHLSVRCMVLLTRCWAVGAEREVRLGGYIVVDHRTTEMMCC